MTKSIFILACKAYTIRIVPQAYSGPGLDIDIESVNGRLVWWACSETKEYEYGTFLLELRNRERHQNIRIL